MRNKTSCALLFLLAGLFTSNLLAADGLGSARSCSDRLTVYADGYIDRSPHRVCSFKVDPEVTLTYLDWGGTGELMVFLPGLGDTAHVFDAFAPQFTRSFHVVGLTPRGFGQSSKPTPCDGSNPSCTDPYSLDRLTDDIRMLLQNLGNRGPITMVGHSIAGDQLTTFAVRFPSSVKRLVYLDAAYSGPDRASRATLLTNFGPALPLLSDPSDPSTVTTLSDLRHDFRQLHGGLWSEALESNLHSQYMLRADLSVDPTDAAKSRDASAALRTSGLTLVPDYTKLSSPALSLYAIAQSIQELFPYAPPNPSPGETEAWQTLVSVNFALILEQSAQFTNSNNAQHARVAVLLPDVEHYVFIDRPQLVGVTMARFLISPK